MSTVVVRFEPCKSNHDRGMVYYRIYKGHNRRMEFSSRLAIPTSAWDSVTKTVIGDAERFRCIRAQIEADLNLLNQIIAEDTAGVMTMGNIINAFKQRRTILK